MWHSAHCYHHQGVENKITIYFEQEMNTYYMFFCDDRNKMIVLVLNQQIGIDTVIVLLQ